MAGCREEWTRSSRFDCLNQAKRGMGRSAAAGGCRDEWAAKKPVTLPMVGTEEGVRDGDRDRKSPLVIVRRRRRDRVRRLDGEPVDGRVTAGMIGWCCCRSPVCVGLLELFVPTVVVVVAVAMKCPSRLPGKVTR